MRRGWCGETGDFYLISLLRNFSEMGKEVEINDNSACKIGCQIPINATVLVLVQDK